MSAPPLNETPSPCKTTARTDSSLDSAENAVVNSAIITALSALRTSGRAHVTRTIGPCRSTRSVSNVMRSHPEDAEARRRQRRVRGRGDAEGEHRARVGRIDDAVIPQPRGGIVRIAFCLVFVKDRTGELVLLFFRHRAAARAERFHADGQQDARRLRSS